MPTTEHASAWRRWRMRWVLQRRPRSATWILNQKQVYIMPSAWGAAVGLMLMVLLLVAINAQANVGYLLTFLLAASSTSSMFQTHASLRGLQLGLQSPPMGFVGQAMTLTVQLHNPTPTQRAALAVAWNHDQPSAQWLALERQSRTVVHLPWSPGQRGWCQVPDLRIWSIYPMGLFRAWSVWRPAQTVLVCPRPEAMAPAWPEQAGQGRSARTAQAGDSEAGHDLRPYRAGDPLKLVLWKKAAKTQPWLRREWPPTDTSHIWLRAQDTGLAETEAQLSRLTAWVMQAHQRDLRYGLELDAATRIPPQKGQAHRQACLQALALWRTPA